NLRLHRDLAAERLIENSAELCTVQKLRELLSKLEPEGEDPETFWKLCEGSGYDARVRWTSACKDGRFDVGLIDQTCSSLEIAAGEVKRGQSRGMTSTAPSGESYATDPLGKSLQQQLIQRLREHLEARL